MRRILGIVLFGAVVLSGCGRSTDNLIRDLKNGSATTRIMAAAKLMGGAEKDRSTTKKLVDALNTDDERLVYIVTQILGSRADTTAVVPLGRVAKNKNPFIRERALFSIGSIGHESGLPFLVEGLKDSIPGVRHSAVTAIGFIHHAPAARMLYTMLRDPADSVRAAAINALYAYRKIPGSGVLASDFALVANDASPLVRFVAVQALGGGFPDTLTAGDLLVESLRDENVHVRIEAINSIKNIRFAEAVPVLKKMYDFATVDEEVSITDAINSITGEVFPPSPNK